MRHGTTLSPKKQYLLTTGEIYLDKVKEGERTGNKNKEYQISRDCLRKIVDALKELNKQEEGKQEYWKSFYSDATGSLVVTFTRFD
jgi:hypothetical protein